MKLYMHHILMFYHNGRCEVQEDSAAASIIHSNLTQLAIMNNAIIMDIHYHENGIKDI